jgi:dienelactone hydrolase
MKPRLAVAALISLTLSVTACQTSGTGTVPGQETRYGDYVAKDADLPIREWEPDGQGPFPLILAAHGCAGWWGDNVETWGRRLSSAGFHVIAVDSFSGRGVRAICEDYLEVAPETRVDDLYQVLSWAAGNRNVDVSQVGLIGWSHGGATVLAAREESRTGNAERREKLPPETQIRAVVAVYPPCRWLSDSSVPTLVFSGRLDDWTPPERCEARARRLPASEVVVFEDATHGFDVAWWREPGQQAFRVPTGPNTNRYGYRFSFNPSARDAAQGQGVRFFRERLSVALGSKS